MEVLTKAFQVFLTQEVHPGIAEMAFQTPSNQTAFPTRLRPQKSQDGIGN